jgi:DNA-binding MarR family transcriptional regulator
MDNLTEQLQVFQQLGRTYRALLSVYEKEVGQPLQRWRMMLHLYDAKQPCSQKEMVESLGIDAGLLSRQLSVLEGLGWVSRVAEANDKRIMQVKLTQAGKSEVQKTLPLRTAFFERVLRDISKNDLDQIKNGLAVLEQRLITSKTDSVG